MKSFLPTIRSRRVSSITLIVAIFALCFSVGEGLRLTPFPVSLTVAPTSQNLLADFIDATVEAAGTLSNVAINFESNTHGPLDVPAQQQKRSHRSALEVLCLSSTGTSEFTTHRFFAFEERSSTRQKQLHFTVLSDRAPPFTS